MRRFLAIALFVGSGLPAAALADGSLLDVQPDLLWPPDHRLVEVRVALHAAPGCETPTALLRGVASSEPDDAPGGSDGRTEGDIRSEEPGSDFSILLRAERDARGTGRTYTLSYEITCASGASVFESVSILVPHDRAGEIDSMDLTLTQTGSGTSISWSEPPGGASCDLVRGDVSSLRLLEGGAVHIGMLSCRDSGFDDADPAPGSAFFYLVGYDDGATCTLGIATAIGPRRSWSGGCRPADS